MGEELRDEELQAAEDQAAQQNSTLVTVQLSKPFTRGGKTYEQFTFDFDSLTGADAERIEGELEILGGYTVAYASNTPFMLRVCARATGIGADIFEALPARDFTKVRNAARNYLFRAETSGKGKGTLSCSSLEFRFQDITGTQIINMENELHRRGRAVFDYASSGALLSLFCAAAASVSEDRLRELPMLDFLRIRNSARDFFMGRE